MLPDSSSGTELLHYWSLATVAEAIAEGRLSSEAVTRHMLDRVAATEPALHAFAVLRADQAMAEACAADAWQAKGGALGALHGVPIAVKDLCAMPGTETRAGGRFPTGFAADTTATVVTRLQQAGAIIIGKTELTEGAWGGHHPEVTPPTNPWNADLWSGVSSSGSGVAVAAGQAFGAIGTDTAGSIRFPSACNHLVGLKPSWGRVSRYGVFPLAETFDHIGPMTRTVLDCALMFQAIAGPDAADPTARDVPTEDWVGAARTGRLAGMRIGLDKAYCLGATDAATAQAFEAAMIVLERAGAVIVPVTMPKVAEQLVPAIAAAMVEAVLSHQSSYPAMVDCYSANFIRLLEVGLATSARDYAAVTVWRRRFSGEMQRLFGEVDMIAAPVSPMRPPAAERLNPISDASPLAAGPLLAFTIPFNLAGLPSLTLPMGDALAGQPLGFQLIGPDLGEASLLSAGAGYEAATGFSALHPRL